MAGKRARGTPAAGNMSSEATRGDVIGRSHSDRLGHGDSVVIIVMIVWTGKDGGAERSKKEESACKLHFKSGCLEIGKFGKSWSDGSC